MIRNYKYKLYISKNTKHLSRLITSANFAWNHIVTLSNRYYKLYHTSVTSSQLQKHMAKLAKKDPFWCKLDSQTMQAISQKYTDALSQHFKQKVLNAAFPDCIKNTFSAVYYSNKADINCTLIKKAEVHSL